MHVANRMVKLAPYMGSFLPGGGGGGPLPSPPPLPPLFATMHHRQMVYLIASSTIGYQKANVNLHEFVFLQMLHGSDFRKFDPCLLNFPHHKTRNIHPHSIFSNMP